MNEEQHKPSDFLPWTLTAVAVLIMAAAVRINAGESGAQTQQDQRSEHVGKAPTP